MGYAAVIAFMALFFLFCGYFLNSHDIPRYWSWMDEISTMMYPYEALLMNQCQTDRRFGTNRDGGNITGIDILKELNISTHGSDKWKNMCI